MTTTMGKYEKYKVSIILAVKNEEKHIKNCLQSLLKQSYHNIEIIVVDNYSTDNTKKVAYKYTNLVFDKKPERSAQRNYGAFRSTGKYLLFLDADMLLTSDVIKECMELVTNAPQIKAIIIPEMSIGSGFWARAKSLERSFYINKSEIEAARFYEKRSFDVIGGFDEKITGPEDWDLSNRVAKKYKIGRIKSIILHNEGNLSLFRSVYKKSYYAKSINLYLDKNDINKFEAVKLIIGRYLIFFGKPKLLFKDPILSLGMLFMKTLEIGLSVLIYLRNNIKKR